MADDDNSLADNSTENADTNDSGVNENPTAQSYPDAPDFLKDIASKSNAPAVDMNYKFNPEFPYSVNGKDVPLNDTLGNAEVKEEPGFFKTVGAEFRSLAPTYEALHAGYEKLNEPSVTDDPRPPDWTPKSNLENFVNVRDENLAYLLAATGPRDQEYRYHRIMSDQEDADTLADGSYTAKALGGLASLADPTSWIPIAGWAKYGKLGEGFLINATRALPGVSAYGVVSAGAEQANKINGNFEDFATDAFTRTVFGSALFGVGGLVSSSADHMSLWESRNVMKNYFQGAIPNLAMDEEGKITGIKITNPEGNLSAAQVDLAQDLANSSFAKTGIFKISSAIRNAPGIKDIASGISELPGAKATGAAINNLGFHFYKYFGSEIPLLLNSPFTAARTFVDRAFAHGIYTKGVVEGEAAPDRFETKMQQSFAKISSISNQMNALHLESNGFSIGNRFARSATDIGLNLYNKGLKVLSQNVDKHDYINRDDFDDQVQNVIFSETASQNASVNQAANIIRKHLDETYTNFRKAHNLPDDWMPTRTAQGYLTRVYNTPYMNTNFNQWRDVISGWLRDSDNVIKQHMQPLKDLDDQIAKQTESHKVLLGRTNITDQQVKKSSDELIALKAKKKGLQENLQNEIRSNPDLQLHAEDWNALSADEAKEIQALSKPIDKAKKEIEFQKQKIAQVKAEASKRKAASMKAKTVSTAKSNQRKADIGELTLEEPQKHLDNLQAELEDEETKLQEKLQSGTVNPRLYYKLKDSSRLELKDPSDRLKLRDTYEEQAAKEGANTDEATVHKFRERDAEAYYHTIMNQTPEETIDQVMGRFTGGTGTSPIKQRTLLIPDEILYNNNFMTKDLMSKVANYTAYLDRRTNLKSVFNEVTLGEGIEPLIAKVNQQFQELHTQLNNNKAELQNKLIDPNLSPKEKKNVMAQLSSVEKEINAKTNRFNNDVDSMKNMYSKMMGLRRYSKGAEQLKSIIMSLTSAATLPFVPVTQITDLSAIALQSGLWPLVRDGIYPVINHLATLAKGKDSESFRNTAPSVHLALQDIGRGFENRNFGFMTNPYLNMGRTVSVTQELAHLSANITGTNYIDNILQKITGSVAQSEFMRILYAFKNGTMSKRDGLYLRKYGIDANKWADRMTTAFEKDGGGKTALGGYQSLHYQWEDKEAANKYADAIFRNIKDTQLQKGMADSPFWTDSPLGAIIAGFSGWGYASLNHYVIPTLQQPDAEKLLGIATMLGAGYLVDPLRRLVRGDEAFPENVTSGQQMWSAFNNAPIFSFAANMLANANLLTGDKLLGNLKSDKYRDRTRVGLLGPTWGQANRLLDIIDAGASGEWNKTDMNKAARMLPLANSFWLAGINKKIIDGLNIPENRKAAHASHGE